MKNSAKGNYFDEEKMQSELLSVLVNVQTVQQLAKFSSFILVVTQVAALFSPPDFSAALYKASLHWLVLCKDFPKPSFQSSLLPRWRTCAAQMHCGISAWQRV